MGAAMSNTGSLRDEISKVWKSRHFLSGHDAMIEGARIALEMALGKLAGCCKHEPPRVDVHLSGAEVRRLLAELDAKPEGT